MSEFLPARDPAPIDEILVDQRDPRAVADLNEINILVNDADLQLTDLSPTDRSRLTVDFYGWEHTDFNMLALADALAQNPPDILIAEAIGGFKDRRLKQDIVDNLHLRGHQVKVRINGESEPIPVYPRLPGVDPLDALTPILMERGSLPLLRKMDLSQEIIDEAGFNHEDIDELLGRAFSGEPYWEYAQPYEELSAIVLAGLVRAGKICKLREDTMAQDISQITANALARSDGPVRVAAFHGAVHTSMRSQISKLGIQTTMTFYPEVRMHPQERMHFWSNTLGLREYVWKGDIKAETATDLMTKTLIGQKIMLSSISDNVNNFEEMTAWVDAAYSRAEQTPTAITEELQRNWQLLHHRGLLGSKRKANKAREDFDQLLEDIATSSNK